MAKPKGKSKKELLNDQIAAAVGAGREFAVETVDFSDPNRAKTCLEVDFPIIPINRLASMEAHAGVTTKPIYLMSKWWARRPSSVFRSILIAAAMRAPSDESKAAKAVWDAYYANYQKRGSMRHISVVDPFMGGGTTIVEGSRLGMRMFGCDLNPVSWFVVSNEMAKVDKAEVNRLLAEIETEVKPQIMPFYACDGPNGERGRWFRKTGRRERKQRPVQLEFEGNAHPDGFEDEDVWEELPASFDIFSLPRSERSSHRYEGPELIYSFWVKHGECQREGCAHRTPLMSTPVLAIKTMTVKSWIDYECPMCRTAFDIERYATRMAPEATLVIAPDEKPFAAMDKTGRFACSHCGFITADETAYLNGESTKLGKAKSKKVSLTLLVHPYWLRGCPASDLEGRTYGGSATDPVDSTVRWNEKRASALRTLEVRGNLPDKVTCPETNLTFYTDERGGTITKTGYFQCQAETCGMEQPISESIAKTRKTAPLANVMVHGYSRKRDAEAQPYGGRFFYVPASSAADDAARKEWEARKDADLRLFWPRSEIPFGHMTHQRQPLPDHGYTFWWQMFSPRQLLVHSQILRAIIESGTFDWEVRQFVLGAFHNYVRNQSMFTFWHQKLDTIAPTLSNGNFHPKSVVVETGVFSPMGYGPWSSAIRPLEPALDWSRSPWELHRIDEAVSPQSDTDTGRVGNTVKIVCGDSLLNTAILECCSATQMTSLGSESIDLVVTDPPFGGLVHYSELSDYFYVWIRLALKDRYPELFGAEYVPKALEAVANIARHPDDADAFYQRILTDCWREAHRVLRAGGILAFTFHHSEDEPWVGVLESLFDAGFYLEATYPIRSDETKGGGEFGSKQIEYDIIHVCRKRMTEPQPISWARLRRLIMDDVRRIKTLLSQHQKDGLPAADLQVIKRGKALEYFSRHYGKVYIEQGREFSIREALAGINQLLDDDAGATGGPEAPPSNAEPYTRQFFRLFYETTQVPRDQMQKFLRGTGIAPSDFTERGWCSEKSKVFTLTPPIELAKAWKGAPRRGMARDFDQTMFLVGGCFEASNIRIIDTLDSPNFAPHPATAELVDWLISHGGSPQIKIAAQRAQTIYRDWLGRNKAKAQEQFSLFDLES